LYASQYPKDVVGMVLVDSSHPNQWYKWLDALPPKSSDEPESIGDARKFLDSQMTDPAGNPERMDISASAAQVRASGNLGDKPLVVLSHSRDWRIAPNLPEAASLQIEQVSEKLQVDLCRLSSHSTHKIAAKAGHYIQADDPQLVIDAILKVVDAAKGAVHTGGPDR
jgi:pimeloyl-ACP methyl ester carboxylesterase